MIKKIGIHVTGLFDQYKANDLIYHNLEHTKTVVKRSCEIAVFYRLNDKDVFIISAAAWFHDTGQLTGGSKLHEVRSVRIMKNFLKKKGLSNEMMDKLEGCIRATKLPQIPKSFLEEVICDADTYNLGTEDFPKTDELLKTEFKRRHMSINNWEEKTLELLLTHKYFTSYCQALLNPGKQENINLMRRILQVKNVK